MYLSSMTLHLLGRLASLCCQPEGIYGLIDLTPDSFLLPWTYQNQLGINAQLLLKAVVVPLFSNIRELLLLYLEK